MDLNCAVGRGDGDRRLHPDVRSLRKGDTLSAQVEIRFGIRIPDVTVNPDAVVPAPHREPLRGSGYSVLPSLRPFGAFPVFWPGATCDVRLARQRSIGSLGGLGRDFLQCACDCWIGRAIDWRGPVHQ